MTTIKRGDTFDVSGFLPLAWPVGTWSVRAKMVDKLNQRTTIVATLTPPAGNENRYSLRLYLSAAVTALLEPGRYCCDVEFTDAAALPDPRVVTTNQFILTVEKDATV